MLKETNLTLKTAVSYHQHPALAHIVFKQNTVELALLLSYQLCMSVVRSRAQKHLASH